MINKKNKNEEGQASIEFILTFMLTIGVFVFFIRLALNMSVGFLAHYATYMASRTYMVMDNNSNTDTSTDSDALEQAQKIFDGFKLSRFGISSSFSRISANTPSDSGKKYEYVGIKYNFKLPLTSFKVFGGDQLLDLESESFLGREPVRVDCYERICEAMKKINNAGGDCKDQTTLYDNGC